MLTLSERMVPVSHEHLQPRELVFIDASVSDYQTLAAGVRDQIEVVVLDPNTDGIQQISAALQSHKGISAIHLVTHGVPGGIQLGNTWLTLQTLPQHTWKIWAWSKVLSNSASLLIYGCEVAQTLEGRKLLYSLSEITGASVAASATKTGSAALGGDWQLDMKLGEVNAALAFRPEVMAAYSAVLAPGDVDKTFGTNGKVVSNQGGYDLADTVLTQPDGKIIVVGTSFILNEDGTRNTDIILTRYNADGSIDGSFGSGGKTVTNIGTYDAVYGATLLSDGKIVALSSDGTSMGSGYRLLRYNSNGTPDVTFGVNGIVTPVSSSISPNNITVQPDGKLLVTGSLPVPSGQDFAVARYNSDGTPDSSFDGDGVVSTNFGAGSYSFATTALVQPNDGKILVAGSRSGNGFALARYFSGGSLDTSFSGDGKVTAAFGYGYGESVNSMILQPDGKILVAGGFSDFSVARFNPDGSLDTSFSGDGKRRIDAGGNGSYSDFPEKVLLQSDGKILLVGRSQGNFAAVRLNADGSTDLTFGTDGIVTVDFGSEGDSAVGAVLQANNKVLLAGSGGEDDDFILTRLQLNDNPNFPVNSPSSPPPAPIEFGNNPGSEKVGTSKKNTLNGGDADDVIKGGGGDDTLNGKGGNDQLLGQGGKDTVRGSGGRDLLDGGTAKDNLLGQGGDDIIAGGGGADTINGGGGKDLIVFNSVNEGTDTINGFNVSQDLLDLRAIFSEPAFAGSSASARLAEFVQIVQVGANAQVQIDADGNGNGTSFVTLATLNNLTATALQTQNFVI